MSNTGFRSVIVLCAALAACSDSATRTVTAPDARLSLSEASADFNLGYTLDEQFDATLATTESFAQLGALQLAVELGAGHRVVTVACDTGLKYLSGDLYQV